MTLRYMALIDAGHVASPQQLARYDAIASENGMSRQLTSAGLIVYAEPGTPVLHLADSAVIIGWLFENGTNAPLRAPASLKRLAVQDTCRQLIDHCWGEYLLLHGGEGASPQPMVMRDPSGGVPCLYSIHQGEGFLGSDLELARQFTGQPLCVDLNFLPHLLAYPHMKTARTGLIGINELLPGTALRILPHGVAITQTWSPWDFVEPGRRYRDIGRATDDVRTALEATITSWARVDDSLLLELSGGLDSSIIAVCLQKSSARIEPCTLLTPVPGADERTYAAAVASAIGRPLHVAEISLADACFDCSPQVDSATPRVTALQVAIDRAMAATAACAGTQSYYSGGGGDTIFCALGNASPAADAFRQRGLLGALSAVRDLSELHLCTLWKAARLTLRKLSTPPRPARSPDYCFSSTQARAVECEGHPWYSAPANAAPGDRERIFDLVNTQSFRDSAPRSRQGSLRLPLLSQPVLETCLRVPSWMWIAQGRNRSIARAAFSDMLPSNVLNRRSKGTFMSYSGAAYRYHLSRIRPHLLDGELATTGLLDLKALANFLDDPHPTDDGSLLRIFDLCMIENWLRQHGNRH